jgi:branched-chain amino acid transport system substrate-binding protein
MFGLPGRLLLCALLCALPAAAQQPAQGPVTVGAVMPQSGILADLGAELRKALILWQEEVNAAGGLGGRHVELALLDDRSASADAGKLYEKLIREEKAELLIGPVGSAATLGAAAMADRNRRVLVNATGAARIVQKPNLRYVFQSAVPLASYGSGALALARAQGLNRVALFARDDPGSREMAQRAREDALKLGFEYAEMEIFATTVDDFAPQAMRARAAGAQAWIAFGQTRDAADMVKTLRRIGYAPRLFVAQGAAHADFVTQLGQAAEYAVGVTPYDPHARTRGNAAFAQAYAKRWSAEPGALAAEGYAAGKLIEEAVRRAGSFDQEKLRAALSALETETPLGAYKVDGSGAQMAARALLTQVQRGRREIVWPEAYATAKLQPYPAWEARKLLR